MNSDVHPLVVILVLLLTLAAIGVWMWGTGEAKEIGGPAEMRLNPDGHLFIQIQNQLLEHDADGVYLRRHDLGDLGVEIVLGSVAFFSNGDILLRRGPDPRSLFDNIRAYQRATNRQSTEPQAPDTGLYRCDLEAMSCELFGSSAIDFKAAHGIFIDWETDEVYITDTTRHLLRKYSADGDALATPVGGVKFPNQLLMHEGRLFVANTNHHRIRVVDPSTESFGRVIETIDVVPGVASRAAQTWPSHVARVGDTWWVNNMRTGMNEGGIYIFDERWRYRRKVTLPPDADPIALLSYQGDVLVSDWNNDRVYRVTSTGELLTDFESAGLDEVLAESLTLRRQFTLYGYAGIALFLLLLVGLAARGLASSMSSQ